MVKILFILSLWNGFSAQNGEKSLRELYQAKKFQSIVQEYGLKVLELERGDQYLLAQSYINSGNKKMAIRVYQIMIEKNPKDAPAYRKLAEVFQMEKKYKEAIEQLKKAIDANPNYEQAYVQLAKTILEYKPRNRLEARNIYEDLVKKFGNKTEYLQNICDLASKEGQHEVAEKACAQTLESSPNNPVALIAIGHLIRDKMEFEKADIYFNKLLLEHGSDPKIATASGDYFRERKQFLKAFEAYEKSIQSEEASYEMVLKARDLACEIHLIDECYLLFIRSCKLRKSIKLEIRKLLAERKSEIDQDWVKKFSNLIKECDSKLKKN